VSDHAYYAAQLAAATASSVIRGFPVALVDCTEADLARLGFQLGPAPYLGNPLLRSATLPAGWGWGELDPHGTSLDAAVSLYIHDQHGRRRVTVYHRPRRRRADGTTEPEHAAAALVTPPQYLLDCLQRRQEPQYDDEWLTPSAATAALAKVLDLLRDREAQAQRLADPSGLGYWAEIARWDRSLAEQAEQLRAGMAGPGDPASGSPTNT